MPEGRVEEHERERDPPLENVLQSRRQHASNLGSDGHVSTENFKEAALGEEDRVVMKSAESWWSAFLPSRAPFGMEDLTQLVDTVSCSIGQHRLQIEAMGFNEFEREASGKSTCGSKVLDIRGQIRIAHFEAKLVTMPEGGIEFKHRFEYGLH